ncbi:MAG TPA: FAD-dependent oxidoreductase [Spirochaetota bacterium]|nr:FAD-dependent oxidoreductase [Spirochaetota bacterium]HNT10433.1 FAD-dependent oxidoreductase [Spirochaetota bacterium]
MAQREKDYDLLVIGGDAAGMSAASQARRIDPAMTIGVFDKGEHISYAACGMPYYIAGQIADSNELIAVDRDEFVAKRNVDITNGAEAVRVDFDAREVVIRVGSEERAYGFRKLVIATGARAFRPPLRGIDAPDVFFLRNLSDGIAIKTRLAEKRPKRIVTIGGGFIGLELAEAFRGLGIETVIVERMESVAMSMSPVIRERIITTLQKNGVTLVTGAEINAIVEAGGALGVVTGAGTFDADMVVISTGVVPNTEFLIASPLAFDSRKAIVVNGKSETNLPGVYAAGDCATVRHLVTGKDVYMPLGSTANKQGRVAGLQVAGVASEVFPGIVGSQFVKIFDLEVGKTGLNAADAEREGVPAESVTATWRSRAGYCPKAQKIFMTLTINADTRHVIGAELAGTDGAALRTNVVAAAIAARMTIDELAYLDLGYAPPFSPVWDPVNAAAQKFVKRGM